jgi:WD40 repeat protein
VIFNIEKNLYMGKYQGHSGPMNKLKWTSDEKQILSVSDDGSVCVWNFFS